MAWRYNTKSSRPKHSTQLVATYISAGKTHAHTHTSPPTPASNLKLQLKCYFPHTKDKVWISHYAVGSVHSAFFLGNTSRNSLSKSLSFNNYLHRKTSSFMKETEPSLSHPFLCSLIPDCLIGASLILETWINERIILQERAKWIPKQNEIPDVMGVYILHKKIQPYRPSIRQSDWAKITSLYQL